MWKGEKGAKCAGYSPVALRALMTLRKSVLPLILSPFMYKDGENNVTALSFGCDQPWYGSWKCPSDCKD